MKKKASDARHPLSFRARLASWMNQFQFLIYTSLLIALLLLGFLWERMFKFVLPGHLGVVYRTLYGGTVTDRTWGEGLHVIPPWDQMTMYEVRLQQRTLDLRVLSDEGLALGVQIVIRFRPNEETLGFLQKDIGPEYFDRLIKPEIESHIRRAFGGRPAHEIYSTVRDVLQELEQFSVLGRFVKSGRGTPVSPYVHIQDLKLTIIDLPKVVEDAIVEKYHQEQLMLAYRYKLERENKEAERKRIEAAGIRDFNQIGGTDILRWRNLEVASEFARSQNSKFIVLGGGQGNPPMFFNINDGSGAAPGGSGSEKSGEPKPGEPKPAAAKEYVDSSAPGRKPPVLKDAVTPPGAPPAQTLNKPNLESPPAKIRAPSRFPMQLEKEARESGQAGAAPPANPWEEAAGAISRAASRSAQ